MTFSQGYLDSLCGIYSIVNADKLINHSTDLESASLFNQIVDYLSEEGILRETIVEGVDNKLMTRLMTDVVQDRIPYAVQHKKKEFRNVAHWWNYSKNFMEENPNRVIILSLDGKLQHLTVVERITDRVLYLKDSSGNPNIRRSMCKLKGYKDLDKYIIFPNECWYLGKE